MVIFWSGWAFAARRVTNKSARQRLMAAILAPASEAHRASRARFRTITGDIIHYAHLQPRFRHSPGHHDPVLDLGGPGLEHVLRNIGELRLVSCLHSVEKFAIEKFVEHEMRHAA